MPDLPQPQNARQIPSLWGLCLFLGLLAILGVIAGVWFIFLQHPLDAALVLTIAILLALTCLGIYRLKRWGVVLFGMVSAVGAINHLAQVFQTHRNLSVADVSGAIGALVSILIAILIPVCLSYLVVVLWKHTR